MWTVAQIRKTFLDFFAARDHKVIPSASLIPIDPALMFTVAGMVPFKPYFLGEEPPPYPRACSVQKCVRLNGKHDDIDNIGLTKRHLSFLEMLGNFSFGDYFKAEAIPWAWELVTEQFGMDGDRLWVTVFEEDDESADIWRDAVGVPADRIVRLGKEENFWDMGAAGPCGPNTEIFFDKGPEFGQAGGPAVDDERYVEFWNVVLMQYRQDAAGNILGLLPKQNVDTGAGLERFTVVLNGLDSVFEVDTIRHVITRAEAVSGVTYGRDEVKDISLRVLADHGRTVTFLVADGVFPSNTGRGYVLRSILRRAVRHAYLLGVERPVMPELIESVVEVMGGDYPDLITRKDAVLDLVGREEARFRQTLRQGVRMLDDELSSLKPGQTLPGEVAFRLSDTFGFPIDLTKEIAGEASIAVDHEGYEALLDEQRQRARADRKARGAAGPTEAWKDVADEFGPTEFTGYRGTAGRGRILALLSTDGERLDNLEAGEEADLFADATPFYAESGGQIGDTGSIVSDTGTARVLDTQWAIAGRLIRHGVRVEAGRLIAGAEADFTVDHDRREAIRKNHTGTHLLHWALRHVLGDHVKQAGSLVAPDRLRFDFSHYQAVTPDELDEVERVANQRVLMNEHVHAFETTKEQAAELGAIAFFGDKYGDLVRVIEAGSESRELCGGTHVDTLGMIGPIAILSEGSIGSNVRRLEALTGAAALEHLRTRSHALARTGAVLRVNPDEVPDRVERLLEEKSAAEAEVRRLKRAAMQDAAVELAAVAERIGPAGLVVARRDGLDPDVLRELAVAVRDQLRPGVAVVAGSPDGQRVSVTAAVSPELTAAITADSLAGAVAKAVGGGGGKGAELATAGGRDPSKLDAALEAARGDARSRLS